MWPIIIGAGIVVLAAFLLGFALSAVAKPVLIGFGIAIALDFLTKNAISKSLRRMIGR